MDSQAVLDSVKANYQRDAFEVWENNAIAVYIPKDTILKEMSVKIELVKSAFFLHIPGTFWYTYHQKSYTCV
jgi:hypothetical protein